VRQSKNRKVESRHGYVECKVGIEQAPGRRFIDEGISQEVAEDAEG
jgi:hypothetical protein